MAKVFPYVGDVVQDAAQATEPRHLGPDMTRDPLGPTIPVEDPTSRVLEVDAVLKVLHEMGRECCSGWQGGGIREDRVGSRTLTPPSHEKRTSTRHVLPALGSAGRHAR